MIDFIGSLHSMCNSTIDFVFFYFPILLFLPSRNYSKIRAGIEKDYGQVCIIDSHAKLFKLARVNIYKNMFVALWLTSISRFISLVCTKML